MLKKVHLCKKCFRRGDEACLLCILALPGATPPPPRAFADVFLTCVDPDPPTKTTRRESPPRGCRAPGPPEAAPPVSPNQAPKHREGETSPPHPPSSTPRTTPLYAHTAFICTATFGAFGYVTLRYCTLNNFRGSVQTRSTVKPALAASCANSSSVYLYELSVHMLSPSLKEISLSPMRTVWFFRLTRCISMRL